MIVRKVTTNYILVYKAIH